MKLRLISEVDITKTGTAGKIGTEIGKSALGAAVDAVPFGGLAEKAGALTIRIVQLIKDKKNAKDLIEKAMSIPDGQREDMNIFDIDDDLWGPDGMLSERSQREVFQLVQAKLSDLVDAKGTLPPNFANDIAITYVKSKLKV